MRRRMTRTAAVIAAILLAPAFEPRCTDLPELDGGQEIATHVTDWRDEVIYQLMVDRFANGDPNNDWNVNPYAPASYHGGDWQGVIDHLNYLDELGVTALWISPVVKNVETDAGVWSYHGYWTQDFLSTNPHFGDLTKLRELVNACHEHGIKVIMDIVTNHVGQVFYYDINGNGQPDESVSGSGGTSEVTHVSEYDPDFDSDGIQAVTSLGESGPADVIFFNEPSINRMPPEPAEFQNPDWYNRMGRVYDWNVWDQVVLGDFPGGLKDVKTTLPEVRRAMVDVFSYWIEATDIDGFRIDTLKHVEHGFWQFFCPEIRAFAASIGKENFLMFGEAFDGDDALIGSYTFDDEVDSVFYFSQKFQVFDDVFKYGAGPSKIEDLFNQRAEHFSSTPNAGGLTGASGEALTAQQLLVNFMDNHDVPRFLYDKPSTAALENALVYLLTADGIPCIYYGTEQSFAGGNDPHNREDLWESGYDTTNETFRLIRHVIDLRKRYAPLRRGTTQIRWASDRTGDEADAGIFAFERTYGGETVLVVVNTSDAHESVTSYAWAGGDDMRTSFAVGTALTNVFADVSTVDDQVTVGADGRLSVTVPARGAKIYVVAP
jgi:alpha-amylase